MNLPREDHGAINNKYLYFNNNKLSGFELQCLELAWSEHEEKKNGAESPLEFVWIF